MATINYDFYNNKDYYSDGKDIENKIIKYIKKYPNDYEETFKHDDSWPVLYHLSDARKNVIRWYPFKENCTVLEIGAGMGTITDELCKKAKKVTSIELSKRRATAIYERNKNMDNLEIIVGNFKNIKINSKYDYILLNGVLEYAALYIDSDNPYIDFINKLKKNLNSDGKILIAIENKFGIKYWCGADEDHTGKMYEGINDYVSSSGIKTFSKKELEELANICNMQSNFYYMFPDYKFPQVIYTDDAIKKGLHANYIEYYCRMMDMLVLEKEIYKQIYEYIPFFANSYFIELSNKKCDVEVEFVKYNIYRNKECNVYTYLKNNKFYKEPIDDDSKEHINNIISISDLLSEKCDCNVKVIPKGDKIYTQLVNGVSLLDKITNYINAGEIKKVEDEINKLYKFILKISGNKLKDTSTTIFEKYNIKLTDAEKNKYNFYEDGFIDLVISNIYIDNDSYKIIDQEWYDKNVPIEYIMYRNIISIPSLNNDVIELKNKLLSKFDINVDLFDKLEEAFQNSVKENNIFFESYQKYSDNQNFIFNIKEWINRKRELEGKNAYNEKHIIELESQVKCLEDELNTIKKKYYKIVNSLPWRILRKIKRIIKKIIRKDV